MISLLVVNYRAAALAAEAIRTARAASIEPLQVVAVDNSVDPLEAEALRAVADVVVVSDSNRGYAGGINLGRRACEGETIVVTNPDVIFGERAIDRLNDELGAGVSVAGPALFWDDEHTWFLPPGDRQTTLEKLDEVLAGRSRAWREQRDRRRFRRRLAFWSLRETTAVSMLSGAVMAIRTADFDDLGGFDERFPLYFEETDFLRRVIERRKRIVYVPAAKCRHIYNQSAGEAADHASASYAISEMRYLEKWSGPFLARLFARLATPAVIPSVYDERDVRAGNDTLPSSALRAPVRLARSLRAGSSPLAEGRRALAATVSRDPSPSESGERVALSERSESKGRVSGDISDDVITEASPSPSFSTAAGHFGRATLPEEIQAALKTDFYLRTVDRVTGAVLATVKISP